MVRFGVTGHMNITEATAPLVYESIRRLFAGEDSAELVGVSCIARGADSVFAQAVLDAAGRLEVVLPSRNYRQEKVKPEHVELFDNLVGLAAEVRTMPFENAGREAYEAANEAVLSSCDRLVAVWDGATGKRGGTASVVDSARRRGVRVDVVWPEGAQRG
ncbi:hypothetical protein AB0H76_13755 [Nocardia sp. NPDC050712]|uniref:hypothetical protein n=1 Tax=Nocardia sp. NPDC050712 TaxID=3155518 RepID=UPI0033E435DB